MVWPNVLLQLVQAGTDAFPPRNRGKTWSSESDSATRQYGQIMLLRMLVAA